MALVTWGNGVVGVSGQIGSVAYSSTGGRSTAKAWKTSTHGLKDMNRPYGLLAKALDAWSKLEGLEKKRWESRWGSPDKGAAAFKRTLLKRFLARGKWDDHFPVGERRPAPVRKFDGAYDRSQKRFVWDPPQSDLGAEKFGGLGMRKYTGASPQRPWYFKKGQENFEDFVIGTPRKGAWGPERPYGDGWTWLFKLGALAVPGAVVTFAFFVFDYEYGEWDDAGSFDAVII